MTTSLHHQAAIPKVQYLSQDVATYYIRFFLASLSLHFPPPLPFFIFSLELVCTKRKAITRFMLLVSDEKVCYMRD